MTADQLRCAEIEYVDAIAIAGEFEVTNLHWKIPGLSNAERDEADSDSYRGNGDEERNSSLGVRAATRRNVWSSRKSPMTDIDTSLAKYQEIETGEAFTLQGPRLLKVEWPRPR